MHVGLYLFDETELFLTYLILQEIVPISKEVPFLGLFSETNFIPLLNRSNSLNCKSCPSGHIFQTRALTERYLISVQ